MGKKRNVSQTMVIRTNLTPLTDSLSIQASDTIAQWYYVNTNTYSPDRTITPLELVPKISSTDERTGRLYTPDFYSVRWYVFDPTNADDYSSDQYWPGLHWVQVTALEPTTGGVMNDYYEPANGGGKLVVQKNVPPVISGDTVAGLNICCVALYRDPRDSAVIVQCSNNVLLITNQDATSDELTINILAPTTTLFNFIKRGFSEKLTPTERQRSLFHLNAKILDGNNNDVTSEYYIHWAGYVNNSTTLQSIDTLPCYTMATQNPAKGQGTNQIILDAMYVENIQIMVRVRKTSTSPFLPFRAYCTLCWDYPNIEGVTVCTTGNAVNTKNRKMKFATIVNFQNNNSMVLTELQKKEHFLMHYIGRMPTQNGFTDIDLGWGQEVVTDSWKLKQTSTYAVPVHTEIYTLGPYEVVTDNNEVVTDDGNVVYDRLY